MFVFFTSDEVASESSLDGHNCLEVTDSYGICPGTPFFLDQAGRYMTELNSFFRSLPLSNAGAPATMRAYASDIRVWVRWLEEVRATTVWGASKGDVQAYYVARRGGRGADPVCAATWNRNVAALTKLYDWAVLNGLSELNPFLKAGSRKSYGRSWRSRDDGKRPVTEKSSERPLKFFSAAEYRQFRDVGVKGLRPDGTEDSSWRGFNGNRNGLFLDLCVSTGLRLSEAAFLFKSQVPSVPDHGSSSVPMLTGEGISKGSSSREVWIPKTILQQASEYLEIERPQVIDQARNLGIYDRPGWVRGRIDELGRLVLSTGERRSLHRLRPSERARLLIADEGTSSFEPAMLWINRRGIPVGREGWRSTFRQASNRCRRLGLDLTSTPHKLRHTFAVHTLKTFMSLGSQFKDNEGSSHSRIYRAIAFDPLRMLQQLMGHRSYETTLIYLDRVHEIDDVFQTGVASHIGLGATGKDRTDEPG